MQTLSPLNQQAIKDLIIARWKKYHLIIAISACTVPLAFVAPSVLNRSDPFHITGRTVAAISLIIGGGLVVKSAGELENLQPQIDKIKNQQIKFLGHGLGAEIYIQEEELNLLAANKVYELENELDPELPQVSPELEPRTALVHKELSELEPNRTNSERTTLTAEPPAPETQISQQQIDIVSRAISEGFTDSEIIKDILHCKGAKYAAGKQLLEQIKEHLGANNA